MYRPPYARRVCLTKYPNGAAKIAKEMNILRVDDTLIFISYEEKRTFDRRARELHN